MEEWKEYKLGDIGEVVGGATPSTSKSSNYDGDIPWITPKDLSNFNDRYITRGERMITKEGFDSCSCKLLPKGSILFSSRAPIGYIAIAANELCTNQGFKSIIPNGEIVDNVFLYYLLLYNKKRIEGLGSGTTFKEVSGKVMKEVVVSIPNLHTQQKNASILSSLDDKIEINRRINENLEQQAQALFKSWFVDFEPFKDQPFVDSELGMIPKGWKVGIVGDICKFENGFAFKSETYTTNGVYKVITIKNVQDGYLDSQGACSLTEKPSKMPDYCTLNVGDILLSLTGNVGRCCLVNEDNLLLNQRVAKIRPLVGTNWGYIYALFRRPEFKDQMISIARGTAQANLSPVETSKLKIVVPPQKEIDSYSTIAKVIYQKVISNIKQSAILASLRDTLLPRLMSGDLEVHDIEQAL